MKTKGSKDRKPRGARQVGFPAYKQSDKYAANIAMSPDMKPFIVAIYHDLLSAVKPDEELPQMEEVMIFKEEDDILQEPKGKIIWDTDITHIQND